jgi:dTDP-4-dehydrorhamnose reductase
MAIRILLFGATGQLGQEIIELAQERNDIMLRTMSSRDADFRHPKEVDAAVRMAGDIDVVINAAAYTRVDQAEVEKESARLVNSISAGALATACEQRKTPLIHISTDYVFDGTKETAYLETDTMKPLGVYGQTKRDGELAVAQAAARHVVLRTSWLYGTYGNNFVKTMLRRGRERKELRIIDDQFGAPTSTANLADAILSIAGTLVKRPGDADLYGTFHYTDKGVTTWRQFAEAIFAASERTPRVVPIRSEEYGAAAPRPRNSRLDCTKCEQVYSLHRQNWQTALAAVLKKLIERGA